MLRSETLVLFTTTNRIQQTSYDVSVSKHRMKSPIAKAWKRSACNALNSKCPNAGIWFIHHGGKILLGLFFISKPTWVRLLHKISLNICISHKSTCLSGM